ncbi:MAG: HIT family protein [Blautia sp.]|nr:HIT family protein [Blautia sp.]
MENCIFCKIASGEIPSAALYEDDDFKVILDMGPAAKGHSLILPKQHAANIYEMPDELLKKAILLAKNTASAFSSSLNCDGVNVVQNNGEAAGQTVHHFHIHVIPRYAGDDSGLGWKPHELTEEDRKAVLQAVSGRILP